MALIMILFISFGIIGHNKEVDEKFCADNMNFLNNLTNAKYSARVNDGGIYCCTIADRESYERDIGTLTYFLFGKHKYYHKEVCENFRYGDSIIRY